MTTSVLLPVLEYLNTTYRPDCEYIDGEIRERKAGETPHSTIQSLFAFIFHMSRKEWGVRVFTEQRVQTSATRFRVPDVAVIRVGVPPGPLLQTPPLICIEVLSPGDSLADLQERLDDYLVMGVENLWIIDPVHRRTWTASEHRIEPLRADAFSVPGTPIRIPLTDLYAELDDLAAGR